MEKPHVPLPRVGLIGFGAMGSAMARNLHARGYAVTVRDIRPEAQQEARDAGMAVADSPAALAAAVDVIAVVVVNAAQIADVLFGTTGSPGEPGCPGLLATGRPGQTVLLCSTIAPQDATQFAQRLSNAGLWAIDAPISGGPARALTGAMSMMLAGPATALEAHAGLLADLAQNRFHLGPQAGDAAKAKLVNNLLAGINLAAGAEALALGMRLGLEPQTIFDIITASSGNSWIFQDRMGRAIQDDFAPRAATPVLTKDLGLAVALAATVQAPTPLGAVAHAQFQHTVALGWAALDDAAVLKTYLHNPANNPVKTTAPG
jgi:3-hydroxyisobutyrate dehydrogenase-like beta-hydroxyacid dehydrogenase